MLILSLNFTPAEATGGTAPAVKLVRVGIEGRYKAGLWTPVEVAVEGAAGLDEPRVAITVPDGDGVPSRVFAPVKSASGAAAGPVLLRVRFGRVKSSMDVELYDGDKPVARRTYRAGQSREFPPAVPSGRRLFVTLGPGPVGVEQALGLLGREAEERADVVQLSDFSQLPRRWYGYEAVDTLVLATSDPAVYAGLAADDPRLAALDEWLAMGGRLVLSAGADADKLFRWDPDTGDPSPEAPLTRFLPGRGLKTISLRRTGAIEIFAGSSEPILRLRGAGHLPVPQLAEVHGRVTVREGNVPLVVDAARGFGRVTFLAADLDRGPVADWPDRDLLLANLLDIPTEPDEEADASTAVMHFGYDDLAGQLRSALDRYPGVRLVPFYLVVVLVVLYVLAIGPGDYFFLRKVVGRMRWTWLTFSLVVVVTSAAAWLLAAWFKGGEVRVHQVDAIDVDVAGGRVRGTTWASVFSPRTARYDFTFRPRLPGGGPAEGADVVAGWMGLPGSALGGMDPQAAEAAVGRGTYDFSPLLDRLDGVPVQVWSSKSLTARWTAPCPALLEVDLVDEDRLPVGTITSALDFPLEDCLLTYGNWAYDLGTIEPGEPVRVGTMLRRRGLKTMLTGRKLLFDAEGKSRRYQTTPYDRATVDPAYILRAMTFYTSGGGRQWTGLANDYQGFIDLSGLLATDRAVLVGYPAADDAADHGALLEVGDRPANAPDTRRAVYRFVLPVRGDEL